jgi:uncharacterized protein (TIGR02996 family)
MDTAVLRAFLDDLKANPVDETPRLVLADWLEEHAATDADHARAQRLRLDRRATQPWSGPRQDRLDALSSDHLATWLGPLARVPGLSGRVSNGLLTLTGSVGALLSTEMRDSADAPEWDWVERLNIAGDDQRCSRIWQQPYLRHVREVNLHSPTLRSDEQMQLFLNSPFLERFNAIGLGHVLSDGDAIEVLTASPRLRQLRSLSLFRVSSEAQLYGLLASPHLGQLHHLALGYSRSDGRLQGLLDHPSLASLRSLLKFDRAVDTRDLDGLRTASCAHTLEVLQVSGYQGEESLSALAGSAMAKLRSLSLLRNQLTPPSAHALATASWQANLEVLDLSDNDLGDGATSLLAVPRPRVEMLLLSHCRLHPEHLRELTWHPAPALRSLRLSGNHFGPHAAEILASWDGVPVLEELDLGDTALGDRGAEILAGWPGLANLRLVVLSDNGISAQGIQALIDSPHRGPHTHLTLIANGATPAQREAVTRGKLSISL